MNSKYVVMVAAMAVILIAATAFATDGAFADGKKKYGKSQAVTQTNSCGNADMPVNVGCQNTASQIQGDDNAAALASAQEFDD